MISKKTTLVLGAGASMPYGFPLGGELRLNILGLRDGFHTLAAAVGLDKHPKLEGLIDEFRKSRLYSIDAFLSHRPEFVEVGKLSIALILLHYEARHAHKLMGDEQNWYDYLWNLLSVGGGVGWSDLTFKNLSIVTFNYDRSFEQFLLNAMMGSYGKSLNEAAQKLRQMSIVHVYGDIGSPIPHLEGYAQYGLVPTRERVEQGAARLKVIPEARDDDPTLTEARKLLTDADAICFLGFGFDKTNLQRLHANKTCAEHPGVPSGIRKIVASSLNLTPAERSAAMAACGVRAHGVIGEKFIDGDCQATLRKTLVLD